MKLKLNKWSSAMQFRHSNAYYFILGHYEVNIKDEYLNELSILKR
jgi:hypothetical protein